MQQRLIGSLSVSSIGLGCMNMSFGYGPADDDNSTLLLNKAIDAGVTFFDTAMLYGNGHNEELIGKAIGHRRGEFVLATKCGLSREGIDGRPEAIIKNCEDSLTRLNTDVIDLYYLHRNDPKVPIEESVGAMDVLKGQGKIREIGLSEVSTNTLERACAENDVAALQSEYSLWSRTPERKILASCKKHNVTFVPFSPLGRAFLTGKALDVTQLPDNDLRCTIARPRFEPAAFAQNSKLLVRYDEIAKANKCTMAQLALAWLLGQQNGSMVPIPGTRNISHMLENSASIELELDDATFAEINELINEATIVGTRYTQDRMVTTDSEND